MPSSLSESKAGHAPELGGVVVSAARWPEEAPQVAALLREFYLFLRHEHDHDFPPIAEDAANLPGEFGAPDGEMFLARRYGEILGCFGLKKFDAATGEAKRMFIRPKGRGLGLGYALVAAVLNEARAKGYKRVLLDSLRTLPDAHRLYYKHGFTLIPPYNDLPGEIALHMEHVF